MKQKILLSILCCTSFVLVILYRWLPMQNVALADVAIGDSSQSVDYGGTSGFYPALKSERYFYTDVGGDLDKYLYRDDLQTTGGQLTFEINIDRYVSRQKVNY